MPDTVEMNGMMTEIIDKLMPMCGKMPDHELWAVYNELEEWKLGVELNILPSDKDNAIKTARSIITHLKKVPDKKLSRKIEQVLMRYTPQPFCLPECA